MFVYMADVEVFISLLLCTSQSPIKSPPFSSVLGVLGCSSLSKTYQEYMTHRTLFSILALSSFPEINPVESRPRILLQSHRSRSFLMTFQITTLLVLYKVSLRIQHQPKTTILIGRKQIQRVQKLHMLNLDSLILFLPLEKGKMLQGAIVAAAVLSLCRKFGTINIGQAGSKRSHEA